MSSLPISASDEYDDEDYFYSKVSKQLISPKISPRAYQIYGVLADYRNRETGTPGLVQTVADDVGCSVSTVKRAIEELVEAAFVTVEHDFGPDDSGLRDLRTTTCTPRAALGVVISDLPGTREVISDVPGSSTVDYPVSHGCTAEGVISDLQRRQIQQDHDKETDKNETTVASSAAPASPEPRTKKPKSS